MTTRRPMPRKRIESWLRLDKADECDLLVNIIPDLKAQKAYSAAIRDGLRIIWELRQGKTDHLFRLFPFLKEGLQGASYASAATMPTLPIFNTLPPAEVRIIENEDERKKLSVANTLAALEDF